MLKLRVVESGICDARCGFRGGPNCDNKPPDHPKCSQAFQPIDGHVLVVHSIAILDKGDLEHQRYVRTLLANDEMQLRHTRSLDSRIVGSVLAILSRE